MKFTRKPLDGRLSRYQGLGLKGSDHEFIKAASAVGAIIGMEDGRRCVRASDGTVLLRERVALKAGDGIGEKSGAPLDPCTRPGIDGRPLVKRKGAPMGPADAIAGFDVPRGSNDDSASGIGGAPKRRKRLSVPAAVLSGEMTTQQWLKKMTDSEGELEDLDEADEEDELDDSDELDELDEADEADEEDELDETEDVDDATDDSDGTMDELDEDSRAAPQGAATDEDDDGDDPDCMADEDDETSKVTPQIGNEDTMEPAGRRGRRRRKTARSTMFLYRTGALAAGESNIIPQQELPTAFRIFAKGKVETTKGTFLFDDAAAKSVMAAWKSYGNDISLDYEHKSVDPASKAGDGLAAGWCKLAIRNGELWAVSVKWTARVAAQIVEGCWRYMSPTFDYNHRTGRVKELLNVALTNIPATKKLTPLVATASVV